MSAKKTVILACICSVWFALAGTAKGQTDYYARYLAHHKVQREFFHTWPNSGSISWGEFSDLDAFAFMYAARGDAYWLDRMVEHIDTMLANMRDTPDPRDVPFWDGYKDGFKGWGDTPYDPQKHYQEYMVHDGHAISPIFKFVEFVYADPALHAKYKAKADLYLKTVEENVIAKWRKSWQADRYKGELKGMGIDLERFGGWYQLRMPNNQYLAYTTALWIAASVSQSPYYKPAEAGLPEFYRTQSAAMVEGFKKDGLVHFDKYDSWWWAYWRTQGKIDNRPEGSHYAAIDVQAVIECYLRGGKVFDEKDMKTFANTFTKAMWNGDKLKPAFAYFVSGDKKKDTDILKPDMVRFCAVDPLIYELADRWMENHPDSIGSNRLTAVMAYLQSKKAGLPLRKDKAPLSAAALIDVVNNDKNGNAVAMAIHSLGELQSAQAVPVLVNVLKGHSSYAARLNAAWALGVVANADDKSVRQALMDALDKDASKWVRCAAADALGRLKVQSALPLLGKYALEGIGRDDKKEVRRHCLYALGLIGTEQAVPFILDHLKKQTAADKEYEWWWARWEAVLALQNIGLKTPEIIAAIEKEAAGQNRDNRRIACRVLGEMGVRESIPVLQKALKDKDWLVRWTAREALEKLPASR